MKQLTQIDKLSKQAWGFAHNTKHSYKTEHDAYTAKFAELIVKECVKIADNHYDTKSAIHDIKEHFGIEE